MRHGPAVAHRQPIFLGDDLFACQPIAAAVQQAGGNFIFTCKPTSHPTIAEYLDGAEREEHRTAAVTRGKRTTMIYRWLSAVPMRDTKDALSVNWFSVEIQNNKGKRTYYNSFVTDLPVAAANVAELAACGRARWKACPRAVMSVVKALVRKIPPGPIIPVAGSDAGMRGGGRALSDG